MTAHQRRPAGATGQGIDPETPVVVPYGLLWAVMQELLRMRTSAGHRALVNQIAHRGHCPTDRGCVPGCIAFDGLVNALADVMLAVVDERLERAS